MKKEGGVSVIPCKVNGLKLSFVFDTGAADVSISMTEALFMLKNDYLSKDDILGTNKYGDATGTISEGIVINLKEIDIAGIKLQNVAATIIKNTNAPLLLGQSAISKLGNVQLDLAANTLTITSKKNTDAASGKTEYFDTYGQEEKEEAKVALATNLKGIDVINNYIAAVGGLENWTNIKDITTKMDLSVSGQSLELIEIKKAPNKYFSELKGGGMVFQKKVFNGVKGKIGGMQGEKEMEAEDIAAMKEEANFLGEVAFLDPSYKVELKGTEKVDGKDAYVVKVTDTKGDFKMYYYDVASKLKVKSSETVEMGSGQKETVSSFFSNYQVAQNGMQLPYTIKQVAGSQVFDIKVKSFELNRGVADKIFE
jgi:phosphotransferase system IIB component